MNTKPEVATVRFVADNYNLENLAATLTKLKTLVSRTPTPVTVEQLKAIAEGEHASVLLLQQIGSEVVGMVHLSINHLEDRAHLGPIVVDKTRGGWGTPLMEDAIAYIKDNFPQLRRIDLSNRPSHDLANWYKKFGFVPRTEVSGDPTTVYRLPLR